MATSVETLALLFDLGGVVVEIDFGRALAHWQARSRLAPEHVHRAFGMDEPYQRHETGAIGADEYFGHLREKLQLECDAAFIHEGWNAIFVREIGETLQMIDSVRTRVPCYALSNTNAVHLAHLEQTWPGMLARFQRVFVSHEIGQRKPQPQAFAHVVQAIGVEPGQVLFFDDLEENVQAARACGLQAVQVRSPADVRDALAAAKLL